MTKEAELEGCHYAGFEGKGRGYQPSMQVDPNEFTLKSPEATSPNDTCILAPKDAFCTSNLLNYKIINLYFLKP